MSLIAKFFVFCAVVLAVAYARPNPDPQLIGYGGALSYGIPLNYGSYAGYSGLPLTYASNYYYGNSLPINAYSPSAYII